MSREEREEGEREHVVGADADEDFARLDAVMRGKRFLQGVAVRLRVEAQAVGGAGGDRGGDARRGRVGTFVRVQLDDVSLRLLAGDVGGDAADIIV